LCLLGEFGRRDVLIAHRAVGCLPRCAPTSATGCGRATSRHVRYENLFRTSFPYSMASPGADDAASIHTGTARAFLPPLLRSATVKQHRVGSEMLGPPQRDITPEQAAARLRDLSDQHYTRAKKA